MIENHFEKYSDLLDEINDKVVELVKLKENWYTLTGVNYNEVKTKGGIQYDIADQLHNIVEKEKELKGKIEEKNELRKKHEKEISNVNDNKKRTILKLFYLDRCSIKQIASCLDISESYTKKLKKWAIEEFIEKVIKEEK